MYGKHALILGSGLYGKLIGEELLKGDVFSGLKVSARNAGRASDLAQLLASASGKPVQWASLDASDTEAVLREAKGADVIINVTHPTGTTVLPAARAAIAAGISYMDINIDMASTRGVLDLDHEARASGVTIVPGCGYDPGLLNMLAGWAAASFDSVEEAHFAGGSHSAVALCPAEAIRFLMNHFGSPVIFRDGKYEDVARCSGAETIVTDEESLKLEVMAATSTQLATFPYAFPSVKLVTCKSGMSPPGTGNDIWRRIFDWGLNSTVPLDVAGIKVCPAEFVASFFSSPVHAMGVRPKLKYYSFRQVTVKGRKGGIAISKTYLCRDPSLFATKRTSALAAEMLALGRIRPGVVTPELIGAGPFLTQAMEWGMVFKGLTNQSPITNHQ